ncbi:MAG: hypothetical protein HFG51_03345 [Lachnospiraceae bacterium]|nr:hypothetical protein [Lachnospiraceae bacterium]
MMSILSKDRRNKMLYKLGLMKIAKAQMKKIDVIKNYRLYNNSNWFISYYKVKKLSKNYDSLFDNIKIENCGYGNFFYSIDDSVRILKKNEIIGNIPVNYSFVLNTSFKENDTIKAINHFIERINDPRITIKKPSNLEEALQLILFWHSLLWQTGHRLVGLGRLDKVLSAYELPQNGKKLIKDFLLTLHQKYEFKSSTMKGDTGQIILLGGLEEDGSYFCNRYTYLFIECLKEIRLPDPKILLRVSKNIPEDLLFAAIDCISTGIGSPLISNDDIIIPLLQEFGYDKCDAYNYGVSACWEPLSIGNSLEQNNLAHLEYGKCANEMITDPEFISCKSYEDVLKLYYKKLHDDVEKKKTSVDEIKWERDPLMSLLMGLDIDISEGGAKYNNYGLLTVGISAAVNTLINIKHFVFETGEYSLEEIRDIIDHNYREGVSPFDRNNNGFGTDSLEAIDLTNQIIKTTEIELKNYRNRFGGKIKFGLSSPAYITVSKNIGPTLDGRRGNQPFSTHISRDKGEPITEIMNFESKLIFSGISANANVIDVIVQQNLIENNKNKFNKLILGGIQAGIFQIQFNVLSYKQLLDAKQHPEKYSNLIVRVWGFSAYFNDLPEEYKNNLIKRAKERERDN